MKGVLHHNMPVKMYGSDYHAADIFEAAYRLNAQHHVRHVIREHVDMMLSVEAIRSLEDVGSMVVRAIHLHRHVLAMKYHYLVRKFSKLLTKFCLCLLGNRDIWPGSRTGRSSGPVRVAGSALPTTDLVLGVEILDFRLRDCDIDLYVH
jgi:hypothetical protein